jgi:hypothetical protein
VNTRPERAIIVRSTINLKTRIIASDVERSPTISSTRAIASNVLTLRGS